MINSFVIKEDYVYYIAILFIGVIFSNQSSEQSSKILKNNILKIIVLAIVLFQNNKNITESLVISGLAVFGGEYFSNYFKEHFQIDTTDGGFKLTGVRQISGPGQSKRLTIVDGKVVENS